MCPKRLPDDEWKRRQKLSSQKNAQQKSQILQYLKKYDEDCGYCCKFCHRVGSLTGGYSGYLKFSCRFCKVRWIMTISLPRKLIPTKNQKNEISSDETDEFDKNYGLSYYKYEDKIIPLNIIEKRKKYYADNQERIKQLSKDDYNKNKERKNQQSREYYQKNIEELTRKRKEKAPEIKQYHKKYYVDHEEQMKQSAKDDYNKNRERKNQQSRDNYKKKRRKRNDIFSN